MLDILRGNIQKKACEAGISGRSGGAPRTKGQHTATVTRTRITAVGVTNTNAVGESNARSKQPLAEGTSKMSRSVFRAGKQGTKSLAEGRSKMSRSVCGAGIGITNTNVVGESNARSEHALAEGTSKMSRPVFRAGKQGTKSPTEGTSKMSRPVLGTGKQGTKPPAEGNILKERQKKVISHKICMDLPNFYAKFSKVQRGIDWCQELTAISKNVKRFVQFARNANIDIVCFIDNSSSTRETYNKWISRRRRELKNGRRYIITGIHRMFRELFQNEGIEVHFTSIDCDDVIASYAHYNNADILSGDQDYFRYVLPNGTSPNYRVFSHWGYKKRGTFLVPHEGPNKTRTRQPAKRSIIDYCPEVMMHTLRFSLSSLKTIDYIIQDNPQVVWSKVDGVYIRGPCSSLTRLNPRIDVRQLRQALYAKLCYSCVVEIIAQWNDDKQKADFIPMVVVSDSTLVYLLHQPSDAVKFFFPNQAKPTCYSVVDWKNHLFSQRVTIAELCCSLPENEGFIPCLRQLLHGM